MAFLLIIALAAAVSALKTTIASSPELGRGASSASYSGKPFSVKLISVMVKNDSYMKPRTRTLMSVSVRRCSRSA